MSILDKHMAGESCHCFPAKPNMLDGEEWLAHTINVFHPELIALSVEKLSKLSARPLSFVEVMASEALLEAFSLCFNHLSLCLVPSDNYSKGHWGLSFFTCFS